MRRIHGGLWTALLFLLAAYPAWLAMLVLHEFGHVLHAFVSGGRPRSASIPLWGFSYTELASNPHPQFIEWGGFVWGCAIPLLLVLAGLRIGGRVRLAALLFGGFCLIANGVYLAAGQFDAIGDAGDLLRHGVPRWLLILCGSLATLLGLWLWHMAGRSPLRPLRVSSRNE